MQNFILVHKLKLQQTKFLHYRNESPKIQVGKGDYDYAD